MGSSAEVGVIHQEHLRLHCQRSGDAEPLLLPAGHAQGALVFSRSLHSSQMAASRRDFSTMSSSFALEWTAVGPRTERDVVIDAHRERIGFLEHHTHPFPQHGSHPHPLKMSLPVQEDLPLDAAALHQVVHPVDGLKKRRLYHSRKAR